MNTSELRQKFLQFFESKGHQIVSSSSLVPHDDPTLLFTNAGMNQFKDVFLGFDKRDYNRATTAQKCVRAGGKHNDLENVGYTARHHTFFEMLGNFSFGDYFKQQAIHFAWEFLTSPEWLNLPKEKLLATVYAEDDEAYNIWHNEIGLPAEKIIRIGDNKGGRYASDNFWQMGDTGPCGPCTEIFYDHGEHIWGGVPGSAEEDGDRYIEIWNNVFMQFNRDEQGNMHPLPKPSVDTGMGLERMAAVLQHVHSNYEIDLFQNLLKAVARETHTPFSMGVPSLKVIADHIRSCSFLIADGVLPSNEGRGYVLRRIIRRAVRHGYKLGQKQPFFYKLVPDLVQEMGDAYPELREKQTQIMDALRGEETRFGETLEKGMGLLENTLSGSLKRLDGEIIFKLYDTYGFPYDLTADICRERDIEMDEDGFNREMEAQRARARAAQNFKANVQLHYDGAETQFTGYTEREGQATVLAIFKDNESVNELRDGENGIIVLDKTPFYAESGGQVGDVGNLIANNVQFEVKDTQKIKASVFGHIGTLVSGSLKVGDTITAQVNNAIREQITKNHSVTHLMHQALREVLGNHVEQKGSLQNADLTRFDISHNQAMTAEQIIEVERKVNFAIMQNVPVKVETMSLEDAQKTGAMMLFGEKYGEFVRVVMMDEFSTELCGGTHVARTGEIGLFKIISESGIAAGVRRVEAITGMKAVEFVQNQEVLLKNIYAEVKAQGEKDVLSKIQTNAKTLKDLEKSLQAAKTELAVHAGAKLLDKAQDLGVARLVVAQIDADAGALRDIVGDLTGKGDNIVVLLASANDDKVALCAGVSKPLTQKVKAGDLVKFVAEQVGGKGGGRPDLAQAGGSDVAKLAGALASVEGWVKSLI
ncbi:alanine--tRNA ligase [Alysiella filiformis]|uniref:Alanine--tRNA ligase n=1 Tax=Alysiella filiformis DSM 16848 TaxID=1120981 RepID=A0A286EB04_9NEIS|nr:alanine--tRNA ligase [Alysiella filiformis]QMT32230.1 alanine--tRNA ligase [Alysiella filiformis]UBQ56850.1 alanine--tRNA ligase [Alysiella filiformis DSM 16848]SOD68092.1 alanyl-tRNA synthetase [Alysiella filiformis DSM 16848]